MLGRTLQRFEATDGDFFWVGVHPELGLVIFDRRCQQGESDAWVRLFVVDESRFGEFVKQAVRGLLLGVSAEFSLVSWSSW